MRPPIKINKILPVANLIVLSILVYLLFCSVYRDRSTESVSGSASKTSQTDFELIQKSLNSSNADFILNHNIFTNTSQKNSRKQTPVFQTENSIVKKQLDLRLLGTVAGDEEIACAVIEDIKTKVQDLY